MGSCFVFQDRSSDRIALAINPRGDFREVLKSIDSVCFPDFVSNPDNLRFAVLELISNSLRAHRESGADEAISVEFRCRDRHIEVEIRDFGGGFDPARLPYDLAADPAGVNHNSAAFEEYRERHKNRRFGMGLLVARKTFPGFSLGFFDRQHRAVSWGEASVWGTLIRLSTAKEGADATREAR
jgi:anti-sigma regulatory factor (Ser/Thr protein kinase)